MQKHREKYEKFLLETLTFAEEKAKAEEQKINNK
jgi:hypothetical protein